MALSAFLIEDEPSIRDNLITLLEDVLDAEVIGTAATEHEAVGWLAANDGKWNLTVLDLFLKEGTGFAVLQHLPRDHEPARVVVLTNSATPENRTRCIALGADAVFDKSHELEAFFDYLMDTQRALLARRV